MTSPVQELRVEDENLGWIIQLPISTSFPATKFEDSL
jgi:hypothetical protein